jgi:tripeptide aminopeptidase
MSSVVERFLRYVQIDTQSNHNSGSHPSTAKQLNLARLLMKELKPLGLTDIEMDVYGNLTATFPANITNSVHPVPTIGLLAHMDTSPDMSGTNVHPQLVENYDGGDIVLNRKLNIVLSPQDFPDLKNYVGKTLITTDGTTLLGADDKAGIAEIMAALEYLSKHPEIKHGKLRIGFTTDEEVSTGIEMFDVQKFGADYAYTLDGEEFGLLQFENFNAARAVVHIKGRNIHPGAAKNKMINASLVAMEFNGMLPPQDRPDATAGYEGFYHMNQMSGDVETATLNYLIRDHSHTKFEERKLWLQRAAEWLNQKYGAATVTVEISNQYANMREKIEPVMYVVELAQNAMEAVGIPPCIAPVRGGTDGARLSWRGLPTPNLFTGGHNFHGRYEFIPTFAMEKATEMLVKLVELATVSAQ